MFKKIAIAATLALLASAASAADQPYFYAGGDIGSTKIDGYSDRETSYGVFGGYQINQNFGVEANYRVLADFEDFGADFKGEQVGISAIGTIPLSNGFSVFGRLGYNHISAEVKGGGMSYKESDNKAVYGVGLGYAFTPTVSARVEVQKPESDVTNLSAGVSFRF